jgi:isoleucyl-tRNA synthetase
MRKAAGFEISDRIVIHHGESDVLGRIIATHGDYVREETLADEIIQGSAPDSAFSEEQTLDVETITVAVLRTP